VEEKMKNILGYITLAGVVIAGGAFADGENSASSGSYMGIEAGIGLSDLKAQQTAQTIANTVGSAVIYEAQNNYLTGRVFFGSEIMSSLALEVGAFAATGLEATYTLVLNGDTATEKYSTQGIDLVGVFTLPDTEFFVKGGIHRSKLQGDASITLSGTTYDVASQSASGTGLVFGLGMNTPLGNGSSVRYSYTQYNDVGGVKGADMSTLSVAYVMPF
jgi:hypothetical protein